MSIPGKMEPVRVLDRLEELYAIGGGHGANRVGGSEDEDQAQRTRHADALCTFDVEPVKRQPNPVDLKRTVETRVRRLKSINAVSIEYPVS